MDDIVKSFVWLLAGLGVLLIGLKLLSENIEKLANAGLKKIFNKTSKNPFVGVGIGAASTAIIQSSAATTVMVVGFVNAGIITLYQATAIIMGANIGTTITAQIVALGDFPLTMYAMALAAIGAFMNMLGKKNKIKAAGLIIAGLGMVFIGLDLMRSGMGPILESPDVQSFIGNINNPFLLLLIGLLFTALLHSSAAVTSIIIVMVGVSGASTLQGNAALYLILGSNIGTCLTAILSSIGTNTNAKRAALIHLLFNVFGVAIFFVILLIFPRFNEVIFQNVFANPATQIAMFHTLFNIVATLIFLPFINLFVKISQFVIRDRVEKVTITHLDERFLQTPSVAIEQTTKEVIHYSDLVMDSLIKSIDGFLNKTLKDESEIRENIVLSDNINQAILDYLLKISAVNILERDERYISALHRVLIDLSREAELADNILKYTKKEIEENYSFSDSAMEGIKEIKECLSLQAGFVNKALVKSYKQDLKKSDEIEERIDSLRSELISQHIARLEEGKCSPSVNSIYINLISNLERAGDHLNYVTHTLYEGKRRDYGAKKEK